MCGENGSTFILGLGFGALLFALCVITPLIALALRFVRQARRDGGCSECGPPQTIFVVRNPNGGYQQVHESQVYPQHMYPPPHGAYAQAYPQQGPHMGEQFVRVPAGDVVHTSVPVAVPVRQPSSVTVARADPIPTNAPGPLPVSTSPEAARPAAATAAPTAAASAVPSSSAGPAGAVGTPVKP